MDSNGIEDYETQSDGLIEIIPQCDDQLKPRVGMSFNSFDVGVRFYKVYAESCGFDVRKGTKRTCPKDGTMTRLYIYCNREGIHKFGEHVNDKTAPSNSRRRVSYRCGCKARISFVYDSVKICVVHKFIEAHSHELCAPEHKKYLMANRKMGYREMQFNMICDRSNLGPTKGHRLYKEMVGNFEEVGSTATEWKNNTRDRKAFIKGSDAQIILNKMALKKQSYPAFYYEYTVDNEDRLRKLFWSDPIARRNYSLFGDVVSFDCTYGTNKYNMIFAPFTGIDNHGRLVTFGAALLPGEDNTIYKWVFEKFLECMGRPPLMIITDQDPAMKIAAEGVLKGTVHRLCMWHIMRKVPEKTKDINRKDEFKQRLVDIVWTNLITITEFEVEWCKLMTDFQLADARWFRDLYNIRHYWIPAYFRDIPMSGVCRTTSISESANNFFSNFLCSNGNLVEFYMHFESAMDTQRESNDLMNSADRHPYLKFKTPMSFEKHAASIYTTSTFYKVQKEIEDSCSRCSIMSVQIENDNKLFEVRDGSDENLKLIYKANVDLIECSCNKFVRDGLLCSHIFSLFNYFKWDCIPDKYIVPRWTRKPYSKLDNNIDELVGERVNLDQKKRKVNRLISSFYKCIGNVEGDEDKLDKMADAVSDLVTVFGSPDGDATSNVQKSELFKMFYGVSPPDTIEVHPPPQVQTKGSCSRLRDRTEILAHRAMKPKRKCKLCGEYGYHDSRNCKKIARG